MAEHAILTGDAGLPSHVDRTVMTVGTFDGVHRGHCDVIERLVDRAQDRGLPSVLVTFDPHPMEVVNPAAAPLLLSTLEEKLEALSGTGLDFVAVLPFTSELSEYSAEDFVDLVLARRFRLAELLIGYDHGFGRQRAGNAGVLQRLGRARGFDVQVVDAVMSADGQSISSSWIRRAVAGGDLARAASALGRPYGVSGKVLAGEQRGRAMGFPTLNLGPPPPRKLLPPEGVYAVRAQTPMGLTAGMMNLGPRPTFGDATTSLEVHLFDTTGDFYDSRVRIEFVARIRETRKFDSRESLMNQLRLDERAARNALTGAVASDNLTG